MTRPRPKRSPASPTVRRPARAPGRRVFWFEKDRADGDQSQVALLGGKGANLAEMARLGLPVPPGFTISTAVCAEFRGGGGRLPDGLEDEVERALSRLERALGRRYGDPANPLLVSVRSGAAASMPGMMDTVLNLGLFPDTVRGLAERSANPRFAWDAYRRFLAMYGDVVLGVRAEGDHAESPFGAALDRAKRERGVELDTALEPADLEALCGHYRELVLRHTGAPFPDDPRAQLWGAIAAVFRSWDNERARSYRALNHIPDQDGTAVTVQAMVFGNLGPTSGTGVAFTRDPASGERRFFGEYLMNAQGEDVVAGLRTPDPIARLERDCPAAWRELRRIQELLERHFRDMQDLEFTIEDGTLYMLQCRSGKRTGAAAVRIACDLVDEGLLEPEEALLRVEPESLTQLLAPIFDPRELSRAAPRQLTRGLAAGPGAACGRAVFGARRAEELSAAGERVVLVRVETSPEDIHGMHAAEGILTARGGMTSHAALIARQMGRVCVVGAGELRIDSARGRLQVGGHTIVEGEWISLDGTRGLVYAGEIPTRPSEVARALLGSGAGARRAAATPLPRAYQRLLEWADAARTLGVRANADQPEQCRAGLAFGADGVGLCRTEHMFFGGEKIDAVREMILAEDAPTRERALRKLLPLQRRDFEGIFRVLGERPAVIRTLDPPLHEFLPHEPEAQRAIAAELGLSLARVKARVAALHEQNPMLGHRGCRLGIVYPEITRMQARAIFEAACNVLKRTGVAPLPELMIPLVASRAELVAQADVVRAVAEEVFERKGVRLRYLVGTMIEVPRAALTAGEIAGAAEFFSFGTNDLTQTTFGISRDDSGGFVPAYVEQGIFADDPFATLDRAGVGRLLRIAVEEGRGARRDLEVGICGEHGGDPRSIELCQELGLDYVSCSPFRVPVARLAAAQAALRARRR